MSQRQITRPGGKHGSANDHFQKVKELAVLKDATVAWIKNSAPEPLEKLLMEGRAAEGVMFTHNSNFFFKGLSAVASAQFRGKPAKTLPIGYAKLNEWQEGEGPARAMTCS